jgi:hypothetical protein
MCMKRMRFFNVFAKLNDVAVFVLGYSNTKQLVKELPAFYITRRFITVLTRTRHRSPQRARLIQSTHFHPVSLRSILILSSHLYLCLPSGLLPSSFPTKSLYAFLTSPIHPHTSRPSHSSRFYCPNNVWWRVHIMELLIMKFNQASCHFPPFWSKYSPYLWWLNYSLQAFTLSYFAFLTADVCMLMAQAWRTN